MIDGFLGRRTPAAWKLNPTVAAPADALTPGLERTGPAIDLDIAMRALNTGAASWMWDWEDAGGDYKDQLYHAWRNLADILARRWDGKEFFHPTELKRWYLRSAAHRVASEIISSGILSGVRSMNSTPRAAGCRGEHSCPFATALEAEHLPTVEKLVVAIRELSLVRPDGLRSGSDV